MGCGSCGTSTSGLPKGCNNNGACGTGADGCGKLSVFDWLSNMKLPNGQEPFNFVEVRFKNDRKFYYKNENGISLNVGEIIAVEGTPGHDIGIVTLTGELVRIQMKKKNLSWEGEDIKKVYRKANQKDVETWQEFREKEKQTMIDARIMAKKLDLEMKICDVEYQGDGAKVTFYYTAEGRVDFRQLIKEYASKFSVRIEMKQIGFRQEAAKIGGIGSCGRELCCSTWLTDFRSVSTAAARYQQLSINSQKLAGQCGKLKCCLNYELDSYLDALNHFPSIESKFETEKGFAQCVKIDVFKKEMWFSYERGSVVWYKFPIEDVQEFLLMNKNGKKTEPLEDLAKNIIENIPDFSDVIEENSLERFERKEKIKRKRVKAKPKANNNTAVNAAKQTNVEVVEKDRNPNQQPKKQNPNQRKKKNPNQNPNAKPQNQEVKTQTLTEGQNPLPAKKKNPNQRKNPNQQKPQQGQNQNAEAKNTNPAALAKKPTVQKNQPNKNAEPKNTDQAGDQAQTEGTKPKSKNKKRFNRGPKPDNPKQ
ncbi:regulatory iron-sulfur-containing complex subunit RicT [Faecalibacter rhinopitheci]|uniref:regulatory iron-sulfur-containing complex subunit RicT n=1 Tax=Faecalibacter rhinopitheci TaxID=2779678 RepID=UPI001D16110D|nr:regulatory iron-sulfur-containing complex subunit RicT [Faecalibacter rhinopitheci]